MSCLAFSGLLILALVLFSIFMLCIVLRDLQFILFLLYYLFQALCVKIVIHVGNRLIDYFNYCGLCLLTVCFILYCTIFVILCVKIVIPCRR